MNRALLFASTGALLALAPGCKEPKPAPPPPPAPAAKAAAPVTRTHAAKHPWFGKPAPPFDLARLDGTGKLSLASLRGKVVVLHFGASW